jgi:hypothetical protein
MPESFYTCRVTTGPVRFRSRVIGCLRDGFITVIVGPSIGLLDGGFTTGLPAELIPPDLRMPNSEFLLHVDPTSQESILERLPPSAG